jgi:hypothetical protein
MASMNSAAENVSRAAPRPTSQLLVAVETAYRVFESYKARFQAQVCQCPVCVSKADRALLLGLPLRSMDGRLLMQYQWSAHNGADPETADDLRYLLPRIFELLMAGDAKMFDDPNMTLSKLGECLWSEQWPKPERDAVAGFLEALLDAALDRDELEPRRYFGTEFTRCSLNLIDYLGMMVKAGWPANAILAVWSRRRDRAAILHRASFRFDVTPHLEPPVNLWITSAAPFPAERALADFAASLETEELMLALSANETDNQARQLLDESFSLRL